MSKRIITISREFGSGGRTIGKEVAQKLGYSYYDKELVRQVAVETGFDEKYIEQAGEYAPSKNWLSFGFAARGSQGAMEGMSANDFLWAIQCRVIRSLAEKEPCVIVGRCADYILREREDSLNVFIHASMAAPGGPYRAPVRLQREEPGKTPGGEGQEAPASTTSTIPTGIGACPRTTTSLWTAESSASSGAWTSSPSWQRHCKKLRRILIFPLTNLQNLIE